MPISSSQKSKMNYSSMRNTITPRMKVFTVGLDQKPPIEKSPDTPPPGYSAPAGGATSIPMGPETTQPIFIKKAKGYKGVLVCMLAVFLIGLFALTLSEIAYNRQRDENFFRLRWAELKHKMGYDYANAAERIYTLRRQQEFQQSQPIVPQNNLLADTTTTSTAKPSMMIDSSVEKDSQQQQQPQENDGSSVSMNDRLAFFRRLLEGIKKHAEEMGFDGTMQVSVLQVDPEQIQQQLRERLFQQQQQEREQHEQNENNDDSNMDGFGEWAMPQALQQQQQQQGGFRFDDDYSGGDFEQPKQAERFRGFNNWQQQQQMPFDHWTANNRVDTPFFPQRPFWWQQQQQHQRPQTPFFFQQGPMPQSPPFSQQQQQPIQSFIQNEIQQPQFPQQQPQQQQPQVIFFPNHNINQFQARQDQQQQPEMNMFPHPHGNNFIPPEDRIQIEPPATLEQLNRWRMNNQKPFDFKSNEGPRGWTHHQEGNDGFIQPQLPQQQPQPHLPIPPPPPPPAAVPLHFGGNFIPQPNALPPNGVPEEPKKWENSQPLPAISIDSVSEPLPSWAIENSLESETPFAEIQPEDDLSHESSPPNTGDSAAAIPRPPSIQPNDNNEESHLNILPIKEIQAELEQQHEHEHSGEIKIHDDKSPINDEPEPPVPVAKEPEPIEVDFPAVKFPISDDVDKQHREPIFFQVDDPHPSQFE